MEFPVSQMGVLRIRIYHMQLFVNTVLVEMEMGVSQHGNGKGKGKTDTYQQWTMDDSNLLLGLLAEAMKNGLRDANGSLSKLNINELMRNNSYFRWDPIGKKVTTSDESHPTHKKLRTECSVDYDDLQLVVRVGTAIGNDSMALGVDDADASIDSISTNFERIYNLMEKIERDREIEKGTTIWDAIKDIPDLDDTTHFRAVELFNTKTKKDMFFKMTPEERSASFDYIILAEDAEINHDEMSEEEDTEIDEEFYEAIKILVISVQAVIHVANELRVIEVGRQIKHPLNPHRINNAFGYKYIHRALNDDPAIFRKDYIGAIDSTHIPTTVMRHDNSSFRDRHGNISQNILATCNFDLEFMYVLAGWEVSSYDSKLLNDALSRRNGPKPMFYYVVLLDCGFANRRQFLAPYRGNGNDPENEKELFNICHASLRNVIERIFGIFKSRFTIFKSTPPFSFKTQVEIVLACVALHNFLCKECRSDEFPIEEESTSSSSPIVEVELEELVSQTQEQQREEANAWRLSIADYMWIERY
ncbi:hypothetical protein Ddye_024717 [Dipteronia dyeriana]|uniref:DDE Tnp4 domain-containing protein n=1 Tax=Dipteronia dyeriana TaxID=168575 RepID=A0AAD9TVD7_9ROSI|nr:hypothetical protein Ddye_024717 [Dipteronia dyeriana]